jgi:hypothetical protein
MTAWISVKSRLPKIGRAVLTFDSDRIQVVAMRERTYIVGNEWRWISVPDKDEWTNVTHWQSLPRPPA